jgi:hypothetical protein
MKFDEPSGSTAQDSSSGNNDAELRNGAAWTGGKFGGALRLDGTDDYAYIEETTNLNFYSSLTIAAWVKPATVTRDQDIVCKNWETSYTGYEFGLNSAGELMFRINPTSSSYTYRTSSGAAITPNVWQHVAVTYDGTNIRFYKNGALKTTVAAGGRLYPAASDIYIGMYESGEDFIFSGTIDELRVYDRTLTSTEINQLYSLTIGTTTTSTTTTSTTTTCVGCTTTTRITTTSSTTTTRASTTTTSTSTTSTTMQPSSCRVGPGYTFASVGTYTASSSSGVASISRSGQYTFYETPHNYLNSMNCPWSGTYTCPTGTNIRFYLRAYTEEGYDYFNIRNSAGTTYISIDGDYGTSYFWTDTYSQRTAACNFVSEEDTAFWGVDLYQIECLTASSTTTTNPTTTTRLTTTTTTASTTTTISNQVVKLIFIHHSCGENWMADSNGGLAIALKNNNYFVSDTNYGWGIDLGDGSTIGDNTDIGNWWDWFRGPDSSEIMSDVYSESSRTFSYTRLGTDPGGSNKIIMFKSCYPNSALRGSVSDSIPSIGSNPLKGASSGSSYHTVSNAKGIYLDLLEYFKLHQDKLFIVVTAPPVVSSSYSSNARAFNLWLVNDYLDNYPYKNVAVYDFYNVLTTNGGSSSVNDLGQSTGNHHRIWNGNIQHQTDGTHNTLAYPTGDDHPSSAGNKKATAEFVPWLNRVYSLWQTG